MWERRRSAGCWSTIWSASGRRPVLVVDADANSNLNEVLGVEAGTTLGEIREDMAQAEKRGDVIPGGMTKAEYAEFRFSEALAEEDDFDMLGHGPDPRQGLLLLCQRHFAGPAGKIHRPVPLYRHRQRSRAWSTSPGACCPMWIRCCWSSDCSRRGIQAVGRIAQLAQDLHLTAGAGPLDCQPGAGRGSSTPACWRRSRSQRPGARQASCPRMRAVYDARLRRASPARTYAADATSQSRRLREIIKALNI